MRRLLSRALVALTLIVGFGAATTGVATADPAGTTGLPSNQSAPAHTMSTARDWWT